MKKVLISLIILLLCSPAIKADAAQIIRCTCYCDYGITASGTEVYEGVGAGRPEDIGKLAVLYEIDEDGRRGELIGVYEILDTGGGRLIRDGQRFDVWQPTKKACYEFSAEHGDYVYIDIMEEEK